MLKAEPEVILLGLGIDIEPGRGLTRYLIKHAAPDVGEVVRRAGRIRDAVAALDAVRGALRGVLEAELAVADAVVQDAEERQEHIGVIKPRAPVPHHAAGEQGHDVIRKALQGRRGDAPVGEVEGEHQPAEGDGLGAVFVMLLLYDAPEEIDRPAAPVLNLVKPVEPLKPGNEIIHKERPGRLDGEGGILFRRAVDELDRALPRNLGVVEAKDQREEEPCDLEVSGRGRRKKREEKPEAEVPFRVGDAGGAVGCKARIESGNHPDHEIRREGAAEPRALPQVLARGLLRDDCAVSGVVHPREHHPRVDEAALQVCLALLVKPLELCMRRISPALEKNLPELRKQPAGCRAADAGLRLILS